MSGSLAFEDLEQAYDLIALALDAAGREREALFLTKLCLVLAHNMDDLAAIEESIAIAGADLDVGRGRCGLHGDADPEKIGA